MTESPTGAVEAPKQAETKTVPLPRLNEESGKRREAEALAAELKQKLADLERAQAGHADTEKFLDDRIKEALGPTQRQIDVLRFANKSGFSEEAASLIMDYQNKGLKPEIAMAAAKAEKPDLFVRPGDAAFRGNVHGSLPPASLNPVVEEKKWDVREEASKAYREGRSFDVPEIIKESIRRRMAAGGFRMPDS